MLHNNNEKPNTVKEDLLEIVASLDCLCQLLQATVVAENTLDPFGLGGMAIILDGLKARTMETLAKVDKDYEPF